MKVQVTMNDIKNGLRGNNTYCPIARAIRRVANKRRVVLGCKLAIVGNKSYILPHAARIFIELFDFGHNVSPFRFTLKDQL